MCVSERKIDFLFLFVQAAFALVFEQFSNHIESGGKSCDSLNFSHFRFYWVCNFYDSITWHRWVIKACIGGAESFKFRVPCHTEKGFRYQSRRQLSHCWKCWCWHGLEFHRSSAFSPFSFAHKNVTLIFLPSLHLSSFPWRAFCMKASARRLRNESQL